MNKAKGADAVVKINSSLLKDVEEFLKAEENNFRFSNRKQLINTAVYEFLKKCRKRGKND